MHNILIGSIAPVSNALASGSSITLAGNAITYNALHAAVLASPVLVYKCFAALACIVGSDKARKILFDNSTNKALHT